MDKRHIIAEIKRLAEGGKPPGVRRFLAETGIREYDWERYWARWSEALVEAGFSPNQFAIPGFSDDEVLGRLAALARELGHLPTETEVRRKKLSDPSFPSERVFRKRGGRLALRVKLKAYCLAHGQEDVAALCGEVAENEQAPKASRASTTSDGFVYLMKSGRYYKIGRSNAVGRREYELGILLPDPPRTLHKIKTDDPPGIEAYWHGRFTEKRRGISEFFDLTAEDVAAFKRPRFM